MWASQREANNLGRNEGKRRPGIFSNEVIKTTPNLPELKLYIYVMYTAMVTPNKDKILILYFNFICPDDG